MPPQSPHYFLSTSFCLREKNKNKIKIVCVAYKGPKRSYPSTSYNPLQKKKKKPAQNFSFHSLKNYSLKSTTPTTTILEAVSNFFDQKIKVIIIHTTTHIHSILLFLSLYLFIYIVSFLVYSILFPI